MSETDALPAREVTVVGEGFSFLEGPRWREGRLWASDFFTRRVLAFGEDGAVEEICTLPDSMPSGLGWDPQGRLLVSSMLERRLLRLDDGALTEVADLSAHAPWWTNDVVVDEAGRAYVGNFGWDDSDPTVRATRLLRVDPDGSVAVAAEDVVFPNGMAIAPDGGTLLLSETFAGRVSAFDRAPDGTLSNRRTWADFAPQGGFATTTAACAAGVPLPDGMALDAEGALWIGDAHGTGAVRVAEGGEILDVVPAGEGQSVFAVALGGADRRTLYMCAAAPYAEGDPADVHVARLLSCRVEVPGVGRP